MSKSALSRKETGGATTSVHEVRSMVDLYDHYDPELIELACAKQKGWWRDYGIEDRGYIDLETEACAVRELSLLCVPGLLQTEAYVRAIFESQPSRDEGARVESDIAVRKIRQRRLKSETDPLHLTAVVDEAALKRPVGGLAVTTGQLRHLLELVELPSVELRVLPEQMGWHCGMEGSFILLEYPDPGDGDVLFLAHAVGSLHVEKELDLQRARLLFEQLFASALSAEASKRLIERAVLELRALDDRRGALHSADLASAGWQKSSYTGSGSGNACVGVAFLDSVVAVRGSKDPDGAALVVSPRSWAAFVRSLDG